MKKLVTFAAVLALGIPVIAQSADELKVKITKDIPSITVKHNGKDVTIQRNQNKDNTVNPAFAKTSRPCPPFCIQPMSLAPGVETIGEVEMIGYLKRVSAGEKGLMVIDSRTPDWVKRGTIPGSVSIPWTILNMAKSDPITIADTVEQNFNAKQDADDKWDFSNAKTLVMFCNGMWCGQSPNNIKSLLKLGYPADKIKWYRGGMQNWSNLGLSTAKPAS